MGLVDLPSLFFSSLGGEFFVAYTPPADGRIHRFTCRTAALALMRVTLVEHARAVPDLWEAFQVDGPFAECAFQWRHALHDHVAASELP